MGGVPRRRRRSLVHRRRASVIVPRMVVDARCATSSHPSDDKRRAGIEAAAPVCDRSGRSRLHAVVDQDRGVGRWVDDQGGVSSDRSDPAGSVRGLDRVLHEGSSSSRSRQHVQARVRCVQRTRLARRCPGRGAVRSSDSRRREATDGDRGAIAAGLDTIRLVLDLPTEGEDLSVVGSSTKVLLEEVPERGVSQRDRGRVRAVPEGDPSRGVPDRISSDLLLLAGMQVAVSHGRAGLPRM